MEAVFRDLNWSIMTIYLDDLLVWSTDFNQYLERLALVFERLISVNLKLKRSKCEFLKTSVQFLGHVVSGLGIMPCEKKIEVVKNYPSPKDKHELKAFLGLSNYYRRFVQDFSKIAHPLHHLLKKDVKYTWNESCEKAF